jgi:putative glutamine transport system permease protein
MIGKTAFKHLPLLLEGLRLTIGLAILSGVASLFLGTVVGLARVIPFRPLRAAGTAYVEFVRNVPPLIFLFLFYFGLPKTGIVLDGFVCGLLGLSLYTAAFVGEAVRAGIQAVGRGQVDAARSLGFGYPGTIRYVVLPQAFAMVLPPLGSIFISLVKDTALVSTIGVADLMLQAELVESRTFATFEIFSAAALFYLLLIVPLSVGVNALERRQARSR